MQRWHDGKRSIVTGRLTIYTPGHSDDAIPHDENRSVGGLVVVPFNGTDPLGLAVAPMTITLKSPAAVSGKFEFLTTRTTVILAGSRFYLDKACTELIEPDSTEIDASASGITYMWRAQTGSRANPGLHFLITLEYVVPDGDVTSNLDAVTFTVLAAQIPTVTFSGPPAVKDPNVRSALEKRPKSAGPQSTDPAWSSND